MREGSSEDLWHTSDGHAIRHLDWGMPPVDVTAKGHMLFMAGRGDAYEKYIESFEHWRLQGWQVSAADWRGQGGSGRLGNDDCTGHIEDFAIWIKDLGEFWADWVKDRQGAHILVGHSMGGHLTMRAVAEKALSPMPDAMVLSAPMLDVLPDNVPMFVKAAFAKIMTMVGDPTRPAWKINEKPSTNPPPRNTYLTHDDERYADEKHWRATRPELKLGPGSWGWVKAAIKSTKVLFKRGTLEKVQIPVMIVGTDADKLVSPAATRRALDRMPNAEALLFGEESRHEVLREVDEVRDKALAAIDEFLDRKVGG